MTVIHAEALFARRPVPARPPSEVATFVAAVGDVPVELRKGRGGRLSTLANAGWLTAILHAALREFPAVRAISGMYYDDKSCDAATIFIDPDMACANGWGDTPVDAQIEVGDACVFVTFDVPKFGGVA